MAIFRVYARNMKIRVVEEEDNNNHKRYKAQNFTQKISYLCQFVEQVSGAYAQWLQRYGVIERLPVGRGGSRPEKQHAFQKLYTIYLDN